MEIMISMLVFVTVAAIIMSLQSYIYRDKIIIFQRLDIYLNSHEKQDLPPELQLSLNKRLSKGWNKLINRLLSRMLTGDKRTDYALRIRKAGHPFGFNVESFLAFKYTVLIIAILLGILTGSAVYFILIILLGYLLPDFLLKNKEKERNELILKELPEVLDLLCVSVEAGLGFDAALQKVVEKGKGPLTEEFEQTLQEINMGKQRREALRDMSQRVNVNDVTVFLGAIIQAGQLGIRIANVLRLQSVQVRANRRIRAEEKAQQAPIKILIPLVLFVFPAVLIVLMGPAVISIMETLFR